MGQTLSKRIRDRRGSDKLKVWTLTADGAKEFEASTVADRRSVDALAAGQYAPIEVVDPHEPDTKITVLRQLRGDPLARLHSHRYIDEAQYHAGRAYQRDWEVAERGAQAIDPTKEAVDGGRPPEPLTDRQIEARNRLVAIGAEIGAKMIRLLRAVLIDGMTIEELTLKVFQRRGQTWTRYYGTMLRDGLDMLAVEYQLAARVPHLPYNKSPAND